MHLLQRDGNSSGKENKKPSVTPKSTSARSAPNAVKNVREKRKQQAKAKNATALEHAKAIFSFSFSSSDSDHI